MSGVDRAPESGQLQKQARALGDPTRHAIFRALAESAEPLDVAALTARFGLHHNAVRQHLAKLVDAGLVVEAQAPAAGRGRPPHVYRVDPSADSRWGVTGPYERLSHLLVEIIRTGDSPVDVGRRAGRKYRVEDAEPEAVVEGITDAMAREGFDPHVRRRGDSVDIVLDTCPFLSTALIDPETACALHLGIAQGVAECTGVVVDELVTRDPRRAGCRLRLCTAPPG